MMFSRLGVLNALSLNDLRHFQFTVGLLGHNLIISQGVFVT